jgi:hypothetical protein
MAVNLRIRSVVACGNWIVALTKSTMFMSIVVGITKTSCHWLPCFGAG